MNTIDLKRAQGLASILHSDLQLSISEQKEAGVMLRQLAAEVERQRDLLSKQAQQHQDLKNWSLLSARALDDCHRVIETIEAESTAEDEDLNKLNARVHELFYQALTLHGLMTRKQLDKATPFRKIDLAAPVVQDPTALEILRNFARDCKALGDRYVADRAAAALKAAEQSDLASK